MTNLNYLQRKIKRNLGWEIDRRNKLLLRKQRIWKFTKMKNKKINANQKELGSSKITKNYQKKSLTCPIRKIVRILTKLGPNRPLKFQHHNSTTSTISI